VRTGDPAAYKLRQFDVIVLGFLPEGMSISSVSDPPSLANLVGEMSGTPVPGVAVPPASLPSG
jgi:hypothetical protein